MGRPQFEKAARLLGRLAVRLTEPDRLPESVSRVPGEILRLQYLVRQLFALPALLGEEISPGPILTGVFGKRAGIDPAVAIAPSPGSAAHRTGTGYGVSRMLRLMDPRGDPR